MSPWRLLAALTLARATMGVQFQSVPALAQPMAEAAGLGPVAVGWLAGLYLLPGIVLSFAGGWMGNRYGDLRVVRISLVAMVVGAAAMLMLTPGWLFAGRIVSGSGAIFLNVLVTKIVADRFAPARLPAAMGILVSSWPLGLALALAVLPGLALAAGLIPALALPAVLAGACLLFLPGGGGQGAEAAPGPADGSGLTGRLFAQAVLAGGVWAFFNVALILLLAFGPAVLGARGLAPVAAAAQVSLLGWALVPGLIAGGWVAARIGRPDATMLAGFAALIGGTLLLYGPATSPRLWLALGLLFGPPGGLIMALPARAATGRARALVFGVYFTVYYIVMPLGPPVAAMLVERTGDPATVLALVIGALAMAVACLLAFRLSLSRPGRARA